VTALPPRPHARGAAPGHGATAPIGPDGGAPRVGPDGGAQRVAGRSSPGTFTGAALPICGVEVLIVAVHPWVLADIHEANLYVVAFHERFRRTIILMAQGPDGAPCFYGPTEVVRVLQGLPFEMIPWRRLLLRAAPPPSWQLPIPPPRGRAALPATATATGEITAAEPISADHPDFSSQPSRASRAGRTTAH